MLKLGYCFPSPNNISGYAPGSTAKYLPKDVVLCFWFDLCGDY